MKRKFIQTDFIKFLLEKHAQNVQGEGQDIPEEEPESEEPKMKVKSIKEFDDEEIDDEETPTEDDVLINELLKEYKRLKKKYENNKFYYRRK